MNTGIFCDEQSVLVWFVNRLQCWFYCLFGVVFLVVMAAMIMIVSSIQNRIRMVCAASLVIFSSILVCGLLSLSMIVYVGFLLIRCVSFVDIF